MNIAKFIATVLVTAIYVSAIWSVIFLNHLEPVTVLSISILFFGGIGIFIGFMKFLVNHWDD
jgi:hypothetical protein